MGNRFIIALAAVGIHLSIGSIYAWSQIASAIYSHEQLPWSLTQITFTFSLAILFLGLTSALMGPFVERKGPRISGMIAATFFGMGLLAAGLAISFKSLILLYLGYGVFGGIGIGLGYITPVSTLLKWFPHRRGMAMGIAIMGFGFGAAIEIILLQTVFPWFHITKLSSALMLLAAVYFILMFISSLALKLPPTQQDDSGSTEAMAISAKEALTTKRFYYLWLMLFINVTCGIGLISVAKLMGIDIIHLSTAMAAVMVMLMSVFNGLGRMFWASMSDYLTRPLTFILFFLLQIIAFYCLSLTTSSLIFIIIFFYGVTCCRLDYLDFHVSGCKEGNSCQE